MRFNISGKDFLRVILGSVVALVIVFLSSVIAVTVYATIQGFAVRGAPDQAVINSFAERSVDMITAVCMVLGAFLGGIIATVKMKKNASSVCVLTGIVTALTGLTLGFIGGLNIWTFVGMATAIAGGFLAGFIKK
ncbi:hypothetical protein JXL83_00030 [candidate division WOR-3 bacterium]|nr:hypothetical protein [candidate division WOR-3 bacterium]